MNINLTSRNYISFNARTPQWHSFGGCGDVSVFRPILVENNTFGPLILGVKKESFSPGEFKILLLNSLNKVLGFEEIKFEPEQKMIMGKYIEVSPEYRESGKRRGHKFGELLRLSSVMTMMKNAFDKINIYSKGPAVYFHSKYKFEPDMSDYFERNKFLEAVMNDSSTNFKDLSKKAAKIYAIAKHQGNTNTGRELTRQTNSLAKEYIERVMANEKSSTAHRLICGMDMVLTKQSVLKNRDFFNELFKKHGIDFQV